VMSLMRERLRKGLSLYAVPSPVRASQDEIMALGGVVRSLPGTRALIGVGLAPDAHPALIDAIP